MSREKGREERNIRRIRLFRVILTLYSIVMLMYNKCHSPRHCVTMKVYDNKKRKICTLQILLRSSHSRFSAIDHFWTYRVVIDCRFESMLNYNIYILFVSYIH